MNTEELLQNSVTRGRIREIRDFFNSSGYFIDHDMIELIYIAVQGLKELPENKNLTT